MDQENLGKDRTQRFVKAFIIFAFGLWAGMWMRGKTGGMLLSDGSYNGGETPAENTGIPGLTGVGQGLTLVGGNAINVNDQPSGMKVEISMLTLAKDAWVVIHRDADGKPGAILSAQRFRAGENQKVTMELIKSTEAEKVYYAMLHADDGEAGFDAKKDVPLTDLEGNAVMMRFVAAAGSDRQ